MADSFVATVRRNAYVDSISLLQASAEVLSLARNGPTLVMILQREAPARKSFQ